MNKLSLLTSISLIGLSTAFSSDFHDQHRSSASLRDLPPEVLGQIAKNLPEKDVIQLRNTTGDKFINTKTRQKEFYQQQSTKPMTFDVSQPSVLKALISFLQESPQGANINLRLINVTIDTLNLILPLCERVSSLDLGHNNIGKIGAQAIANSESLKNLTSLDLGYNNIGPEVAQAIANSESLKNLTSLNLSWNDIGPEGAQAIASSAILQNLTSLNLAGNGIGPEGELAIKKRYPFAVFF